MQAGLAYPGQFRVPKRCFQFVPTLLLAVLISACGGGGIGPITSNQVALGSATLSWTPPTRNTDGSLLTDLASYKIYYGNRSRNYHTSIQIDNPGIAIYVVEYLPPNTYFFAITATNSSGLESAFSHEAIRQVL